MTTAHPSAVSLPIVPAASGDTGSARLKVMSLPILEQVLREQQDLTAVERFSQRHDAGEADAQAGRYQALLPTHAPGVGQQLAFEVDLDKCTGCKACVAACHSLNGLDDGESFRSVGLLHGGSPEAPSQQTVTTACHHCLDPACMSGCPVNAYEKDAVTGIVRHLDDQCIGCQYCTLTCPYEVPQFNARLGIVRKCDMCSDRLAQGEAPACVRGCPNEAIAIRVVQTQTVLEEAQIGALVPGAPSSGITAPTTTYKTERALPRNLLPADFFSVHPAHEHLPLVVMLVLTQLSVGAFAVDELLRPLLPGSVVMLLRPLQATVALLLGMAALGASTMHLGRPQYAFRALLGLRHSWLSREILAFGVFSGFAALDAGACWLAGRELGPRFEGLRQIAERAQEPLGALVTVSGLFGVLCSVMLYHRTRRLFWTASRTGFKFFMTTAILGVATTVWVGSVSALLHPVPGPLLLEATTWLSRALFALTLVKLGGEATLFLHLRDKQYGDLRRSALLLRRELAAWTIARFTVATFGILAVPVVLAAVNGAPGAEWPICIGATVSLALLLVGELLERATFFSAVASPRMPGGLS